MNTIERLAKEGIATSTPVVFGEIPELMKSKEIVYRVQWYDGEDTTVRLYTEDGYMFVGTIYGHKPEVLMIWEAFENVNNDEFVMDVLTTLNAQGMVENITNYKGHLELVETVTNPEKEDPFKFMRYEYKWVWNKD